MRSEKRSQFSESKGPGRPGIRGRFVLSSLAVLAGLLLVCTLTPTHSTVWAGWGEQHGDSGYSIELGSVSVYPGAEVVEVPIWLTSDQDVDTFQMGLDYEDVLLSLGSVDIDGSSIDPESVTVTLDETDGGLETVTLEFTTSVSAGSAMRIGTLIFDIDTDEHELLDASTTVEISPASDPDFTTAINETYLPDVVSGMVTFNIESGMTVDVSAGSYFDEPVAEFSLWSEEELTTFSMGLDYEDVLLTRVSEGEGLAEIDVEFDLEVDEVDGGIEITIVFEEGVVLPAGAVILEVEFSTEDPTAGDFDVSVDSPSLDESAIDAPESITVPLANVFIRGDVNYSGTPTIADAELLLGYALAKGSVACEEACDVNDDGKVSILDAVVLLSYLFQGADQPPAPFPDPGPDTDEDVFDCL